MPRTSDETRHLLKMDQMRAKRLDGEIQELKVGISELESIRIGLVSNCILNTKKKKANTIAGLCKTSWNFSEISTSRRHSAETTRITA